MDYSMYTYVFIYIIIQQISRKINYLFHSNTSPKLLKYICQYGFISRYYRCDVLLYSKISINVLYNKQLAPNLFEKKKHIIRNVNILGLFLNCYNILPTCSCSALSMKCFTASILLSSNISSLKYFSYFMRQPETVLSFKLTFDT